MERMYTCLINSDTIGENIYLFHSVFQLYLVYSGRRSLKTVVRICHCSDKAETGTGYHQL